MPRKITCHRVVLSFSLRESQNLKKHPREITEEVLREITHQLREMGWDGVDLNLRLDPDCTDVDITEVT